MFKDKVVAWLNGRLAAENQDTMELKVLKDIIPLRYKWTKRMGLIFLVLAIILFIALDTNSLMDVVMFSTLLISSFMWYIGWEIISALYSLKIFNYGRAEALLLKYQEEQKAKDKKEEDKEE